MAKDVISSDNARSEAAEAAIGTEAEGTLETLALCKRRRLSAKQHRPDVKAPVVDVSPLETVAAAGAPSQKRRLLQWKKHADKFGTEAPKPQGGPGPLARKGMGRRRKAEEADDADAVVPADGPVTRNTRPRPAHGGSSKSAIEESEKLAEEALARGDASLDTLQFCLDQIEIPWNGNRKNVIPKGQTEVRGLLFGLYYYGGSFGVSSATKNHPWLFKLLVAAIRAHDPDFPFTGIQLNYCYVSKPHVDKNNLGCSQIVGFGDYKGGEVWIHDEAVAGDDRVVHKLDPEDFDVSGQYRAGHDYPGRVEDCRNKWVEFDGNKLHFTLPFTGTRYTLVYFVCEQFKQVPEEVQNELAACGLDFPWQKTDGLEERLRQKLSDRADLRLRLAEERKEEARLEMMRRGRCIGRIWAEGWGHQCTAMCAEDSDMCTQHIKGDRWKTHGRFGGPLPKAKEEEMAKCQQKMVKQGKLPPAGEPWTELVVLGDSALAPVAKGGPLQQWLTAPATPGNNTKPESKKSSKKASAAEAKNSTLDRFVAASAADGSKAAGVGDQFTFGEEQENVGLDEGVDID